MHIKDVVIGKSYLITGNKSARRECGDHNFETGDLVTVEKVNKHDRDAFCRSVTDGETWHVHVDDLDEVTVQPVNTEHVNEGTGMKIIVERASGSIPPVPNSVYEAFVHQEVFNSDNYNPKTFRDVGKNHREVNGMYIRETVLGGWVIKIESIESFIKEYGSCLVAYNDKVELMTVTIYDASLE